MYHIYGLNVTLAGGLYMGCKHIVLPSFKYDYDDDEDDNDNEDEDDYDNDTFADQTNLCL